MVVIFGEIYANRGGANPVQGFHRAIATAVLAGEDGEAGLEAYVRDNDDLRPF